MPRAPAESPMLAQYRRLKAECGDALLMFRLGDFYELFGDDAERAAPVLEVVLTSREICPGVRTPMCGVPHHALTTHLGRLLGRNFSVAVAEQMDEPAPGKGLVRREITRLLTPGTLSDPDLLAGAAEALLVSVAAGSLAVADVSTGSIRVARWDDAAGGTHDPAAIAEAAEYELHRLGPREIIAPEGAVPEWARRYADGGGVRLTPRPDHEFDVGTGEAPDAASGPRPYEGPGAEGDPALAGLLAYLRRTLRGELAGLRPPELYHPGRSLALDPTAQRNLELVRRLTDGAAGGTLLAVLDRTLTAMGRRLLRFWLLHPLQDPAEIRARQDAVAELAQRPLFREGLRSALRGVADLDRLAARCAAERASPRELGALGASLRALPEALRSLAGTTSALLASHVGAVDPLGDVAAELGRALATDAPAHLREGGVFAAGYDIDLDGLRAAGQEGRTWVAGLEADERRRTGIRSLKVGYNRVFGYYFEVTAANLASVPGDFTRKQTTAGGERFVTARLKELEERILGAQEKALRREEALFAELRARVAAYAAALQATAAAVAALDVLASLAAVAAQGGWVRPVVDRSHDLVIRAGRHPVLEEQIGPGRFVPNDTALGARAPRFLLITGPNMAGKSTYMRQVALIAILAHLGSFVPAAEVRIGLVDRIFTRVGASDDLAGGRSTFMVEMTEVAGCLRHATARSLVLLDEVGRGTGTADGLAIAWAVAEALVGRLRARTLFATHYHELTAAVAGLPGAGNAHAAVREGRDGVVFLHRMLPGATDRSYGIAVAQLAGVPEHVIARARQVLAALQAEGTSPLPARLEAAAAREPERRAPVAGPHAALLARLAAVDVMRLTPLQALDLLAVLAAEASTLDGDGTGSAAARGAPASLEPS